LGKEGTNSEQKNDELAVPDHNNTNGSEDGTSGSGGDEDESNHANLVSDSDHDSITKGGGPSADRFSDGHMSSFHEVSKAYSNEDF